MNKYRLALLGGLTGAAVLLTAACGGAERTPAGPGITAPQPAATQQAANSAAATATPAADAMEPADAPGQATGNAEADLLAQGMEIFQKTAGAVGCAACHGMDARGNTELGAPNILERNEDDIWNALDTRAQMSFISLTPQQVRAVAAYLAHLNEQQ